ncbi:MAG: hypothetical protein LBD23_18995 [Oscillospiraceae bacterium]|jgi:hypothetical protein|nr:hypothetical protein [Oscillospiraceae bacterium]
MNIYDYFSSLDIVNHCKEIGHVFTSLEMTVIIDISDRTIEEKHAAWHEIIADYPDMPIPESNGFDKGHDSLHEYLKEYMAHTKKQINDFMTPRKDEVYHFSTFRKIGLYDSDDKDDNGLYTTFEKVWENLQEWENEYSCAWKDGYRAVVKKQKIDADEYHASVEIDSNMQLLSIYYKYDSGLSWGMNSLDEICIYIPTPFELGDILIDKIGKPFVLTDLLYWFDNYKNSPNGYCGWDMQAQGYFFHKGKFEWDHGFQINELRYFSGELEGQDRFLVHVGKFLKKDINCLHCLIGAHEKYALELRLDEINSDWQMVYVLKNIEGNNEASKSISISQGYNPPVTIRAKKDAWFEIISEYANVKTVGSDIDEETMTITVDITKKDAMDLVAKYGDNVEILHPADLV